MIPDKQTVFLIGPPAAGKSTVGGPVAKLVKARFRTLDDWTPRGEKMTDAQVQVALDRLFEATNPMNEIVEFCHHDYDELFDKLDYRIFWISRKVFVTASLSVCEARNALRQSPVQQSYVERAWQSTQQLIARCSTVKSPGFLVMDTTDQSVDSSIAAVARFVTRKK